MQVEKTDNHKPMHRDSNVDSHLSQFSINRPSGTASSSKPSLSSLSTDSDQAKSILQNTQGTIIQPSDSHNYVPNTTQGPPAAELPLGVYPGDVNETYDGSNSSAPKFSIDSSNLGSEMRDLQPEMANTAVDIDMTMSNDPEVSLHFDPTLFDQSMLSTINWLPNEFLSTATISQPQLTAVSSQYDQSFGPGPYFSRTAWQPPVVQAGQISPLHPEPVSQSPSVHVPLGNMESPNQYPHALSETSPHTESVGSAKRSADYYVDGAGSRLPKYRKKHPPWSRTSAEPVDAGRHMLLEDSEHRFEFPIISELQTDQISKDVVRFAQRIEPSAYDKIYRHFLSLCRHENPFFEVFESDGFPTLDECNWFIAFFFDSFQAVYPVLHLPTFDPNSCHWLLTLSIVAVGCHVAHMPEMEQCTNALHELIRRGIYVEV
ncbi:uncharacterized protein N7529_002728 [Penicillium soppii]|uniref:uncharacterized protein n=1 Tax=Penicillium soppii TaxID=69789 RepID=UPI002546E726|nr:uncharacterized protein N7529_002728 [Penicillium soppii]KAJ5874298.1 hypothetical protein N7529_002728 [Penicillium soppii]